MMYFCAIQLIREGTKETVTVSNGRCSVKTERAKLHGEELGVLCWVGEELTEQEAMMKSSVI